MDAQISALLAIGRERMAEERAKTAAEQRTKETAIQAAVDNLYDDLIDAMGVGEDIRQYLTTNAHENLLSLSSWRVHMCLDGIGPIDIMAERYAGVDRTWHIDYYQVQRATPGGTYAYREGYNTKLLSDALAWAEEEARKLARYIATNEATIAAAEIAEAVDEPERSSEGADMRRKLSSCTSTMDVLSIIAECLIRRAYGD